MRTKPFHVTIVGAGPGGLCLAQGLRKHGIAFDVYERDAATDSRTQGYRIRIDQTGQDALAACLPTTSYKMFQNTCALPPAGVNVLDNQLRSVSGRWISSWKRTPANNNDDADRCAHRQTMREVLMAGIEAKIHFGRALSRYEERDEGVILHFADGTTIHTDLLVGADGLHSVVRRQLLPGHDPVDTGSICIYGKVPMHRWDNARLPNILQDRTSIVFAGDTSVIMDAMRFAPSAFDSPESATRLSRVHDYQYWAIIGMRRAFGLRNGSVLPTSGDVRALVHQAARPWSGPLKTVFDASDPADMIAASIHGATSVPRWKTGRATLLGDAIHAMSPAGGLGANTALNDARALTECLAGTGNDKSSLLESVGRYEEAMRVHGSAALRASDASAKALFDVM